MGFISSCQPLPPPVVDTTPHPTPSLYRSTTASFYEEQGSVSSASTIGRRRQVKLTGRGDEVEEEEEGGQGRGRGGGDLYPGEGGEDRGFKVCVRWQ